MLRITILSELVASVHVAPVIEHPPAAKIFNVFTLLYLIRKLLVPEFYQVQPKHIKEDVKIVEVSI